MGHVHAEETPPGPAKTPHTINYILTTANSFIRPLFPSFPPHHQLSHGGLSLDCSPKPMLDGVSPPPAAPEPPHLPSAQPFQLLYLNPAQTKAAPNPWDNPEGALGASPRLGASSGSPACPQQQGSPKDTRRGSGLVCLFVVGFEKSQGHAENGHP